MAQVVQMRGLSGSSERSSPMTGLQAIITSSCKTNMSNNKNPRNHDGSQEFQGTEPETKQDM